MEIENKLKNLIELISNVMEAYTAAIFINDGSGFLNLFIYESFSRDIIKGVRIEEGKGIIGWVSREKKNVLAKHFERDTTTLKFYNRDEEIKSLLATPLPES